jgi:hypothetical protein
MYSSLEFLDITVFFGQWHNLLDDNTAPINLFNDIVYHDASLKDSAFDEIFMGTSNGIDAIIFSPLG